MSRQRRKRAKASPPRPSRALLTPSMRPARVILNQNSFTNSQKSATISLRASRPRREKLDYVAAPRVFRPRGYVRLCPEDASRRTGGGRESLRRAARNTFTLITYVFSSLMNRVHLLNTSCARTTYCRCGISSRRGSVVRYYHTGAKK